MTTCKDCRFHVPVGEKEGKKLGVCYRYPPTMFAAQTSGAPPVGSDVTWCGEFKRKPPAKRKPRR